jgi:hypothetical protein
MKCPNGHIPVRSPNLVPDHITLVCRECRIMRLVELDTPWVPSLGGVDKLTDLVERKRLEAAAERRSQRHDELETAIRDMGWE